MKNKTKSLAITAVVALAAVVGLTASGCRSDENSNATHSQSADQNDGKKINPFDGLEVSFGGLVYDGSVYGDITFETNTDGCAEFVKEYVTFDCDTTNATNGSTVMVQAKCNSQDLKNNDITLTAVEQLYTVSLEEIPEDLTEEQRKQLTDYVWDAALKQAGKYYPSEDELYAGKYGEWLVQSMSDPQLVTETYFIQDQYQELPNTLYKAVWEINLTLECIAPSAWDTNAVGDIVNEKIFVSGVVEPFTVCEGKVLLPTEDTNTAANYLERYFIGRVISSCGSSPSSGHYATDKYEDSDFLFVKSYQ